MITLHNDRHWDDNDATGSPYDHCGALAVGKSRSPGAARWGAVSAKTRNDTEDLALTACISGNEQCEVREWVCT
ncbi:DUF4189 domain-containing protein [Microvirga makkahensis]|uniref:DUF4189 domain-containing protein n=1 Tax=Microvirga makkahensis TaxID=1128670 RepID=UPI0031B5F395